MTRTTKLCIAKQRLLLNKGTLNERTRCLRSWRPKTLMVCSWKTSSWFSYLYSLSEATLYEQELARYKAIDAQREKANNAKLKGLIFHASIVLLSLISFAFRFLKQGREKGGGYIGRHGCFWGLNLCLLSGLKGRQQIPLYLHILLPGQYALVYIE